MIEYSKILANDIVAIFLTNKGVKECYILKMIIIKELIQSF